MVNSFKNTPINYLFLKVSVELRTERPPLPYHAAQWSAENRLQTPNQTFPNVQIDSLPLLPSARHFVDAIHSVKPSQNAIYSKICALRKGDITTNSSFDVPSLSRDDPSQHNSQRNHVFL